MTTPATSTLLDLVWALGQRVPSETELVTTAAFLVNTDTVLLGGNFAGAKIDLDQSTKGGQSSGTNRFQAVTSLRNKAGSTQLHFLEELLTFIEQTLNETQ